VPKATFTLNDDTIDKLFKKLPLETTQYIFNMKFFNRFRKKKIEAIALKTSNFYYNIDPMGQLAKTVTGLLQMKKTNFDI
jgi:hypothetical protein